MKTRKISITSRTSWSRTAPIGGHAPGRAGVPRPRRLGWPSRLLVAAAATATFSAASASAPEPEKFVRTLTDKALAILADDSLTLRAKTDRLEDELGYCCDFATTSKLVLASNWKKFSAEQQKEFVGMFRDYLVATYRKNLDGYAGETVEIVGGREESRGDYTVKTRIVRSGQNEVLVDYRLRKSALAEWRIIDITAEGISLISNLRSQFREIYSNGGVDGVLDTIRSKIAE